MKTGGEDMVRTLTRLVGDGTMVLFNIALIVSAIKYAHEGTSQDRQEPDCDGDVSPLSVDGVPLKCIKHDSYSSSCPS
jgi:hypothetical protein